jgi:hypothetical protein
MTIDQSIRSEKARAFAPQSPTTAPATTTRSETGRTDARFAQVVEGGAAPELRARMDAIVVDELIPALSAEPGFAGALNLVDRLSGNALMIILWATREQAELAPSERGTPFLKALADVAAISSGQRRPITVWEVNAHA